MIFRIIGALVTGVQNIIISNRLKKLENKTSTLLERQERMLQWMVEQKNNAQKLDDKSSGFVEGRK